MDIGYISLYGVSVKGLVMAGILGILAFNASGANVGLLNAIEQVESGGRADAVGDSGSAVGAYQIWKICVDDINRIKGKKIYTYQDRLNKTKSRQMCEIYIDHYGKGMDDISKARIWNGGPRGYKLKSTVKYGNKVKKHL